MTSDRGLLVVITVATFVVGLVLVASGVYLIVRGEAGSTEISIFGQSLKSSSLGLVTTFLGVVLLVVIVRRVLASMDRAAGDVERAIEPAAPPNAPGREPRPQVAPAPAPRARPIGPLLVADLEPEDLEHERLLARTDHSVIEQCRLGDQEVVLKRTTRALCDVAALERIAGHKIASRGRLDFTLATPLKVWADEDFAYELYPFYDGLTLDKVVSRNRYPISGELLGDFYVAAIDSLTELHELGVLHRDVSPSNLLLQRDGRLVLLDASFCCTTDGEQVPVENKDYSAPELRLGRAVRQSDWYSVACSLYFLTAGVSPRWRPREEVQATIRRLEIGAYGHADARQKLFLSLLQEDPAQRPTRVSAVRLEASSAQPDFSLRAVVDLGNLDRYLVLSRDSYSFVDKEEIVPFLKALPDNVVEAIERKGPLILKPNRGKIVQEIESFSGGADPWAR